MAVANPYSKEWEEWKRGMEENRSRRWRERVSRWANVEVSDEEEEEEDDGQEAESKGCREEEVSTDEEEGKNVDMGLETEEEGENEAGRGIEVVEKGDEEEDREAIEVDDNVDEEEVEENAMEREFEVVDEKDEELKKQEEIKESKNKDEEEDSDMKNAKEAAEEEEEIVNEAEREVEEIKEVGAVEENEETEEEHVEEVEKEAEELREEGEKIQENRERDKEDSDTKEAKEMGEEEGEGEKEVQECKGVDEEEEKGEMEAEDMEEENEMGREVQACGEVEEKEVKVAEEAEDEQEGEQGFDRDVRWDVEKDRLDSEKEQVEEEDDEEEEHQEQDETGHCLAEQFREQLRTEDESIRQNQESTSREEDEVDAGEDFPDSFESENEDSDFTGSDYDYYNFQRLQDEERAVEEQYKHLEELEDPAGKSWRSENSLSERKEQEDECDKLTGEEETATESLTTQDKAFQDDHEKLEEDESTDDEAAALSADDDEDNNDEDVVKIYYKKAYLTDAFSTLTEFRSSSLLTDLTLSTEDRKSFHVHSLVLAAVSSLIRESLSRCNVENEREEVRGVHRWSLSLGPEVDHVGLEAVVEFAYIGLISCLNKDTVNQIRAAAQKLGAPRVLDLCKEEEEKSKKAGGQKKEERRSAADQMMISLQSIKQLWRDRVGCDVVLEALGGSFHVHRVMLAVCSDFFRGMFTLGMKESLQPVVTLPFLLASELQVLIDCSYSGALPLSWSCVFEITTTALQLQYQPALSLCLTFLQQEINPHSCLDVASFAEAYEMVHLLEVAEDFVLRQFQRVARTSKFKDLPAKQLLRYLNSHSLCVPSELVVFKAVVAWIQAKPKKRLRLAKELMKTIHFPLMTFKEFKEVQSMNMWSDHSLAELYEAVFEDFCANETPPQSQCRIYLPKESLVLVGGDQTFEDLGSRSISRELWFGNSLQNHTGIRKAMEWRRLGEMPDPARFSHEVAVLEGQLYVFGGKKYYGTSDTLNSVCRYDPVRNSWESLAEMQEKRFSFSVVVLDGKIYAIGGNSDLDYIEGVECYCPIANSWSFACPLDLPLSAHVAKVLHGQIFVSGGLSSNDQCLASMFLYHPETGSNYLANMTEPRAHHCMETLGDCLYVAGGITMGNLINFVDQLACEVYNPELDSWTAFTYLPMPHVGAGGAVLEGKFYVLGGYTQDDYSDTKLVHRYDPTTQRWENMGKMPGPNNDIRACLLRLPPHFRL